jgi:DNA polymerase-1
MAENLMKKKGNRERLILIDGFGIVFRAYHAVPPNLKTARGEFTNATFGFTSMLLEVMRRDIPDYIVMTFDKGRTFRHDEDESYKANRPDTPDDLLQQIPRIREVVEAMGINIQELEGYEADDLIGTLATQAREKGLETLIITGDNDLLQLVNEDTTAVLPGAGPKARFNDPRYFDIEKVKEKYGFGPEFVPDYKAIVGDKSDNIPNIPGLGEKTATGLISQFGHLEEILERSGEVKTPKVQQALKDYKEQAIKSKRLATIVTNVPGITLDLEMARAHQINRQRLLEIFRELEFNSLMSKVPNPQGNGTLEAEKSAEVKNKQIRAGVQQLSLFGSGEVTPTTETPENYQLINTPEQLKVAIARVQETGRFAFDTETTAKNPMLADLVGVSFSPAPGEAYYIPVGHREAKNQASWAEISPILATLFNDPKLESIAHNATYDLLVLMRHGINMAVLNFSFDTMIAAQVLGLNAIGLKELAINRLAIEMTNIEKLIGSGKGQLTMDLVSVEDVMPYACADADMCLRLSDDLTPELQNNNLWKLFKEVEMPLVCVIASMEITGVCLDTAKMMQTSTLLYQKMRELEDEIFGYVGHNFNINSTDQLGKVLFEELGLQAGKKTATKKFSTDKKTLDSLREAHPIVNAVLEWRQMGKLKSTYVDALPLLVNKETGRVHTSYNQIGASSGRISSNDPNLQNIPIRSEIGREVRRSFIADNASSHRLFKDEDSVLVSADYSQIELRLLAHLTGDKTLVEAFMADKDIHRTTAAIVFGVPEDKVTPDMRRVAKTVNFGIIYGLSPFGLSQQIELSVSDAKRFIDTYNETYPAIKAYLDQTPDKARETGYVQTLFGRRRYMPELSASNHIVRQEAERAAINMPVQGTAADIVKIAMRRVYDEINRQKLRSKMLLQVHDELVFEAPKSEVPLLAKLVKEKMEGVAKDIALIVPLKADFKVGLNWGDLENFQE